MNYWQDFVKPNFTSASSEDDDEYSEVDYSVPLNGVGDKRKLGLEGGFLNMTREDVAGIFLPVIDEIERLVQDQILQVSIAGMQPKAILLVGGFGSSEYLFRRLQSAVVNVTVM
ncbi:hypothetical protein CNMCM5793_009004 [Aspergillus hiratsukae]|uniref:Actin n=1 Tax=Aspergillus hiratsukae TaxID=1194566 RepID=A0A8H6UHU1_9EURO|nr:hypothetical protein CNMCM5793_009004 [Aspergillus hiratsukae]